MEMLSKILVGVVALEHLYILVLQMFLWTSVNGLKTFGMSQVLAATRAL
jgi:putative membrane protein